MPAAGLSFTTTAVGASATFTPLALAAGPLFMAAPTAAESVRRARVKVPRVVYVVAVVAFAAYMIERDNRGPGGDHAGLLLGPFVIGFVADGLSLRVGLSLAVVLSAVIVTCARRLPDVAVTAAAHHA